MNQPASAAGQSQKQMLCLWIWKAASSSIFYNILENAYIQALLLSVVDENIWTEDSFHFYAPYNDVLRTQQVPLHTFPNVSP